MAAGLKLPLGVDTKGRGALASKEEQNHKIISLALSDLDNENAFQQDIGIDADFLFGLPNATQKAVIRQRVISAFNRFEALELYKLVRTSIRFEGRAEGELTLVFNYINLESDEEETFSQRVAAKVL